MASPTFFPEGSSPRQNDTRWRILQKILGATVDGGGGGSGAGNTVGAGVPVANGTTLGQGYWDTTNKNLYIWDADGWNIH